jgi:hypothetical protein
LFDKVSSESEVSDRELEKWKDDNQVEKDEEEAEKVEKDEEEEEKVEKEEEDEKVEQEEGDEHLMDEEQVEREELEELCCVTLFLCLSVSDFVPVSFSVRFARVLLMIRMMTT